jgi:glycosyltransferase involved in cell wall biosynthesis
MNDYFDGYYCILLVRNGEKTIASSLSSIINQNEPPKKIVIVNDGSTDNTSKYIEKVRNSKDSIVETIETENKTTDYSRIHELLNLGINSNYKFFMIASHDCIFEKQYSEKILTEMRLDEKLVVASGDYSTSKNVFPRGAGRFIRQSFFDKYFQKFPDRFRHESLIVWRAIIEDYKIKNIHEARYKHEEQLGHKHNFVTWGIAMKNVGYYPPYAVGRCLVNFLKNKEIGRKGSLKMLLAYISHNSSHNHNENNLTEKEIKMKIKEYQKKLIKKYLKEIFRKKL